MSIALSAGELPYKYIVTAFIGAEGSNDTSSFVTNLIADYQTALNKGYFGEALGESDVETFRMASAYYYWAGPLEKHVAPPGKPHPQDEQINYPTLGENAYEIKLLKVESAMADSSFGVYSPLRATEFLRPEGLMYILPRFNHWQVDAGDSSKVHVSTNLPPEPGYTTNDYWYLSDSIGKKPVLILSYEMEDWTGVVSLSAYVEHLSRAYSNQVEIIQISRRSGHHGDMRMDEHAYFGPDTNALPLEGLSYRRGEIDVTPERLARISMLSWMRDPYHTIPLHADDLGSRAAYSFNDSDGANYAWYTLLDKNGRVMFYNNLIRMPIPDHTSSDQSLNGFYSPFYGSSIIETSLRELLRHGGASENDLNDVKVPDQPTRVFLSNSGHWGASFTVETVNVQSGLLGIEMTAKYHKIEGRRRYTRTNCNFTLQVNSDTRITTGDEDAFVHTNLNAIQVGDQVFIDFRVPDGMHLETNRPTVGEYLTEQGGGNPSGSYRKYGSNFLGKRYTTLTMDMLDGQTFEAYRVSTLTFLDLRIRKQRNFWGRITQVQSNETQIVVEMDTNSLANAYGYNAWQKYGTNGLGQADAEINHKSWESPASKLSNIDRWLSSLEARTYTFKVDSSVAITRNGWPEKKFSDLREGDTVSVTYHPPYEDVAATNGAIYPERILASSRIGFIVSPTRSPSPKKALR